MCGGHGSLCVYIYIYIHTYIYVIYIVGRAKVDSFTIGFRVHDARK